MTDSISQLTNDFDEVNARNRAISVRNLSTEFGQVDIHRAGPSPRAEREVLPADEGTK